MEFVTDQPDLKGNAYLYHVADLFEHMEMGIAAAIPDSPSSDDLRTVARTAQDILDSENDGTLTPHQLWKCIEYIAEVSTKWTDPESDDLAYQAHDFLEHMIFIFRERFVELVPDSKEQVQQWINLHTLQQVLNRNISREKNNPSFSKKLITKLFHRKTNGELR